MISTDQVPRYICLIYDVLSHHFYLASDNPVFSVYFIFCQLNSPELLHSVSSTSSNFRGRFFDFDLFSFRQSTFRVFRSNASMQVHISRSSSRFSLLISCSSCFVIDFRIIVLPVFSLRAANSSRKSISRSLSFDCTRQAGRSLCVDCFGAVNLDQFRKQQMKSFCGF